MTNSTSSLPHPAPPPTAKSEEAVAVQYQHSAGLPELLTGLDMSVLITTYQAGKVVTLGVHEGKIQGRFTHFDRAMGLTRTPKGLALGTQKAIWQLPADREIAGLIAFSVVVRSLFYASNLIRIDTHRPKIVS
ncbi:MAG: DUF4915 domain-containing protein [Pseudanabaena sp.]